MPTLALHLGGAVNAGAGRGLNVEALALTRSVGNRGWGGRRSMDEGPPGPSLGTPVREARPKGLDRASVLQSTTWASNPSLREPPHHMIGLDHLVPRSLPVIVFFKGRRPRCPGRAPGHTYASLRVPWQSTRTSRQAGRQDGHGRRGRRPEQQRPARRPVLGLGDFPPAPCLSLCSSRAPSSAQG